MKVASKVCITRIFHLYVAYSAIIETEIEGRCHQSQLPRAAIAQ